MIMARELIPQDVDYAVDHALRGEYIPFPFEDEYLEKIWELSQNHDAYDPQALRDEGYLLLAHMAELDRKYGFVT